MPAFTPSVPYTAHVHIYRNEALQPHRRPGSGGLRKVRWSQPGRGKRGGIRVIYYLKRADRVIWMLTIHAKNETENIAPHVLRAIKGEIDG